MKKFKIVYIDHSWNLKTTIVLADSEKEALEKVDKKKGSDFRVLKQIN